MIEKLIIQVVLILLPIIATGIVVLIALASSYLKNKTGAINNQLVQNVLHTAIAEADKVAKEAVIYTNQTLVDDIKEKSADGKLTKEEQREAMNKAIDYFLNHLSKGSVDILTKSLGPIEVWLAEYLDSKVGEVKQNKLSEQVIELANPK